MTTGLHAVNLADKWLDMLGGTAFSAPANTYVQLHTGDPGAAGTTAASAETTRVQATWGASASGTKSITTTLEWASWTAGTETISHVSIWDASSAGNVLWTGALSASKTVNNTDTLQITALSVSLSPLTA
jgi:hypothetical protein